MDWYPRYITLWRAKTMHLDPFQEGCYIRLVDHYMDTRQPLPDSDAVLARIIGISVEQWLRDASGIVRAFFTPKKGLLFQDRCDKVLAQQDDKSKKQTEKSKKGAAARWSKTKEIDATGMDQAMPIDARREDRTGHIDNKKKIPPLTPPTRFDEFWEMFPKQRRGSRDKAMTAYRSALTKASADEVVAGTERYAGSDEVRRGFAKGAAAWLNDDRWTHEYRSPSQKASEPATHRRTYSDDVQSAMQGALAGFNTGGEDEIH